MHCLEIVSVRLANINAFEEAITFCRDILKHGESCRSELYRSLGPDTDLSIHIHWTSGPFSREKSRLGFDLAYGLGKYGLVSHGLWLVQQEILAGQRPVGA